jgi:hypothetical protein
LVLAVAPAFSQSIADGNYFLTNGYSGKNLDDSGGSLSLGNIMIQWTPTGGNNQIWYVEHVSGDWYTLKNATSSLYLYGLGSDYYVTQNMIANASELHVPIIIDGISTNIQDGIPSDYDQILWEITPVNDGYQLLNRSTGKV